MQLNKNHDLEKNIIKKGIIRAKEQDWNNIAREYFRIYNTPGRPPERLILFVLFSTIFCS